MKTFPLSTPSERTAGIAFSIVMSAVLLVLLWALRGNLGLLICIGLFVLLIIALLAVYVISVLKAVCIPHPEEKKLEVRGLPNRMLDLSTATMLETVSVKNGQSEGRMLVFSDAEGNVVAKIRTYFTSQRGVLAEPMSIELAKVLGLEHHANVPEWEYIPEKRAEHEKQVAEEQKKAAKERAKARAKLRIEKQKVKMGYKNMKK